VTALPTVAPPTAGTFRVALFEGTGGRPLDPAARSELVATLLQRGYAVTVVRPGGSVSSVSAGTLVVLGRFDEPKPDRVEGAVTVYFREIDGLAPPQVIEAVDRVRD
jgi:hypothetical protein